MPSEEVVFVARLRVKPGREDELRQAFEAEIGPSRREPGCRAFHVHQTREDSAVFVLYEAWADQAALDAHFDTPHFKAISEVFAEVLAEPLENGVTYLASEITEKS